MSPRTLILLAACGLALTACGKQGRLTPPDGPLWGSKPAVPPPPVNVEKKVDKDDRPEKPAPNAKTPKSDTTSTPDIPQ
jgi:hypothetical protein